MSLGIAASRRCSVTHVHGHVSVHSWPRVSARVVSVFVFECAYVSARRGVRLPGSLAGHLVCRRCGGEGTEGPGRGGARAGAAGAASGVGGPRQSGPTPRSRREARREGSA